MGVGLFKYEEKLHLSTDNNSIIILHFYINFLSKILHLEKKLF